jgi:hypothetical protein
MKIQTKVQKEVLAEVAAECINNKISLVLASKKKVLIDGEGLGCAGYFDPEEMVLAVATKRPDWFLTLLHEFGHMQQWRDDPKSFEGDEDEDFWDWLTGSKELSKRKLRHSVNEIRRMELDCEMRVADCIVRNPELRIDLSTYVRQANAYLYLYTVVAKHRKWISMRKKAPYIVPEIVRLMPDTLPQNYWKLPKSYERLVVKHCF